MSALAKLIIRPRLRSDGIDPLSMLGGAQRRGEMPNVCQIGTKASVLSRYRIPG
jgi:hypothetical protein